MKIKSEKQLIGVYLKLYFFYTLRYLAHIQRSRSLVRMYNKKASSIKSKPMYGKVSEF